MSSIESKIQELQEQFDKAFDEENFSLAKQLKEEIKKLKAENASSESKKDDELEAAKKSETPIYSTLLAISKYKPVPQEKIDCIESTVEKLLETGPQAKEPGLLLGKIQCGKTDTFENIIGLAFDRGIDIAIVLTKNNRSLAEQTKKRFKKDYDVFKPTDDATQKNVIKIYDILDVWKNLTPARVDDCKTVIVCKKEGQNLKHLIEMFTKGEYGAHFRKKKVLIVDDEADFASRNYKSVKLNPVFDEDGRPVPQERETTLAKISQQIDDFRQIPEFCRYLQVTATPYCLYLQPNGELFLNGNKVMPFRPRFTSLVPVHDKYIGGKQYFEESQDEDSMYSHLYRKVEQKCMDILGHEDKRYLNSSIASGNLYGLTYALVSYLTGTAIRCIQQKAEGKKFHSSALVHAEVDKDDHDWQLRVIKRLLKDIEKCFVNEDNSDERINKAFKDIYADFEKSNEKARKQGLISVTLPSKEDILEQIRYMFITNNVRPQVVNSDNDINSLLDEESGELRLDHIANIFIGGSILDRGITIKNMLCFFYGRNPKKFQQDTVLQHARMYGSRDKEDMAVTRLHTTDVIYKALVRMNELDNQLRQWFIDGKDLEEPNAIFVGYDKDIKPCATQKIKASNTLVLNAQKRIVPSGFWTGTKTEISKTVGEIDSIISSHPGFQTKGDDLFFEMDKQTAFDILKKIESTYRYDDQYFNKEHKNDIMELMCALEYCTSKSGDKLYVLYRDDRNMSRIRENGAFVDAPDDGHTDTKPSREKAETQPVLMLIRQNGKKILDDSNKNIGWNNTPFYWPVLMTQQNIDPVTFALEQKGKKKETVTDDGDLLDGIDPADVLNMTYDGSLIAHFGEEGAEYAAGEMIETRSIKETTASRFILKGEDGKWLINSNVNNPEAITSLYSMNDGEFPFVPKPYKYMVLRSSRTSSADVMLLELHDTSEYLYDTHVNIDEEGYLLDRDSNKPYRLINTRDTLIDKNLNETDFTNQDVCQWIIIYPIKKVLKFKTNQPIVPDGEDE